MMSNNEEKEITPLDSIIAKVDEYIKNPKAVTPETLAELKGELEDLKSVIDEEDTSDDSTEMEPKDDKKPALIISIGHAMKKKAMCLIALLGLLTIVHADSTAYSRYDWWETPHGEQVSQCVYRPFFINSVSISSQMADGSYTSAISTYPVMLHTVIVSSGALATSNGTLTLWNTRGSTTNVDGNIIGVIDTKTLGTYHYDVYLDSGLTVNNISTCNVTINYRER